MANMLNLAIVQTSCRDRDRQVNIDRVSAYIEQAAQAGAQVILPPELFATPYFCRQEQEQFFGWATTVDQDPAIARCRQLAKTYQIIIPVSFFEQAGQAYYNSLALIDHQGEIQGLYRKSHIPDGPGYEEKFYFRPGNTGFRVWQTIYGNLGIGICWDQWFPECARAMVLMGAEILLYPTAIGSEPAEPDLNTKDPWQRAMIGHGVCNVIPVAAANRIGAEGEPPEQIQFYGHSFIADQRGEKVAELDHLSSGIATASFDLAEIKLQRASFGFFRDRRPDLYQSISEL
ncbi:MAG: N-carbamoylputrescine amidase [Pseudanabaenaceae cyanobacterium bins.68]|nr:N-carbamoylputrescine amidase [Pseudanabaenaceae cyanobacterium bins.68]